MKFAKNLGLLTLSAFIAMPAQASDKRDFSACDGRLQPGRQDDGMRGQAGWQPYQLTPSQGMDTISACSRALASPRLLPTQTLRRAHLLRARAAAYLRASDTAKALADLDLAEVATNDFAADRFYQRSMAVSLKLLRALALAQSDKMDEAIPLVRSAMDARPYALQIQQAGATILQAARPIGAPSPSPWISAMRLSPDTATRALISETEIGNFAGVLRLRSNVSLTWPTEPLGPMAFVARTPEFMQLLSSMIVSLHIAYARAATGDSAGARKDLGDVRGKVTAIRFLPPKGQLAYASPSATKALEAYVDTRARQIEARIAVAEARYSNAISALIANPMPRDAATLELLTALKAAVPAKDAGVLPDVAPFRSELNQRRVKELGEAISATLIAPETPRAVVDYEKARPNILGALIGGAFSMGTSLLGGIKSTDGFRSTANADGTTKVEFIGNTPSAALVQEMTLLRAAEITRAAGKPGFVIVERKDFSRTLTTTRQGMPIGSVPTGFKTELNIRFAEPGAKGEQMIDAMTVIDTLGPLYYEENRAIS